MRVPGSDEPGEDASVELSDPRLRRIWERAGRPRSKPDEGSSLSSRSIPTLATPVSERPTLTTRFSEVTESHPEWLWQDRIPKRALTVLDGNPGDGKSTLSLDIAARLTIGRPLPFEDATTSRRPADVIVASFEDGVESTMKPRLMAAGGSPERAHLLCNMPDNFGRPGVGGNRWSVPAHASYLRDEILRLGVLLVIVDPFVSFLSPGHKQTSDQDVRAALDSLSDIARKTGCGFLLFRHHTKGSNGDARHRGAGAVGISAVARSILTVGRDTASPESGSYVLAQAKSSLGPTAPSIRYRIGSDSNYGASTVIWGEESSVSADELMMDRPRDADPSERRQIADVLRQLAAERGFLTCEAARDGVRSAGFSVHPRTVSRAAIDAGFRPALSGGFPPIRYYVLNGHEPPSLDSQVDAANDLGAVPTGPNREDVAVSPGVDTPADPVRTGEEEPPEGIS